MYSLIIVDDEAMERYGLELRIQNNFPEIELLPSASNGIEFLSMVETHRPDIAIVDIEMPGLSGLEAIKVMRMKSISTKFIINTAYDDFTYIQEALALGASGYLLKPIDQQSFNDTLKRVMATIDQERAYSQEYQETSEMLRQMKLAIGDNIMSSILLGEPNQESFQIYSKTLHEPFQGGFFAAVSIMGGNSTSVSLMIVRQLIEDHLSAFITQFHMKTYQGVLYLFLIPGQNVNEESYQVWATNVAKYLSEKIQQKTGCNVSFGFSKWKRDFSQMNEAFRECNLALSHGEVAAFFEEPSLEPFPVVAIAPYLDAIVPDLVTEKRLTKKVRSQLEQFMERLEQEEYTLAYMRIAMLNLALSIWDRAKTQYDMALPSFSLIQSIQRVQTVKSKEELLDEMLECLDKMMVRPQLKNTQGSYVEQTILYIEKNFREDISLDIIAEKIGISSFYLSRLIKQQLKVTFVDLLTEVRIRHAILMIRQGTYTVREIGISVGYSNSNYFYKVFKKSTGMTVGEMKNYFRQISAGAEK